MQATFNQSGNKSVIMLEGDLTSHMKELKEIFTKALQESDDVSIAIVTALTGSVMSTAAVFRPPKCDSLKRINPHRKPAQASMMR
jgi:hypothetical protein